MTTLADPTSSPAARAHHVATDIVTVTTGEVEGLARFPFELRTALSSEFAQRNPPSILVPTLGVGTDLFDAPRRLRYRDAEPPRRAFPRRSVGTRVGGGAAI